MTRLRRSCRNRSRRPPEAPRAGTSPAAADPSYSSPTAGAHRLRGAALALGAACALWLAGASAAQAQTLVSNIGQTSVTSQIPRTTDVAQPFRTGGNADGYFLTSIEIRLQTVTTATLPDVALRQGSPTGTKVGGGNLDKPAAMSTAGQHNYNYAAPAPVTLLPNTTYWVVASGGSLSTTGWAASVSTTLDSGSLPGWTFPGVQIRTGTNAFAPLSSNAYMLLRVNGTPALTPPSLVSVTRGSGRDVTVAFTRAAYGPLALFKHHRIQTCSGGCGSESNWHTRWTSSVNAAGDVSVVLRGSAPTSGYKRYRVTAFNGVDWASDEILLRAGADTTAPTLASAEVASRILTLTYDEPLDGTSLPPASAFTPSGGPTVTDVLPIPAGGREVKLLLSGIYPASVFFPVSVSYTPNDAGSMPIQDLAGNRAGALTNRSVTNNTAADPTMVFEIPDQAAETDTAFSYTFPENTFANANGQFNDHLTYTATRADGTALPVWLTFTGATRTFSGTPRSWHTTGRFSVKVTATQFGFTITASDTFDIVLRQGPVNPSWARIVDVWFSEPADGYYWTAGEQLDMFVQFSSPVTVSPRHNPGRPGNTILLTTAPELASTVPGGQGGNVCGTVSWPGGPGYHGASTNQDFLYNRGSGTDTLVFRCPVAGGPFTRLSIPANTITLKDSSTSVNWTARIRSGSWSRAPHPAYSQTSAGDGQVGPRPVAVFIDGAGPDGYWSPGGTATGTDRRVGRARTLTFEADDPEIVVRFTEAVTATEAGTEGKLWLVADLSGLVGDYGSRRIAFHYNAAATTARGIGTDLVFKPMTGIDLGLWNGAIIWGAPYSLFKRTGNVLSVPANALQLQAQLDGYYGYDASASIRGESSGLIASLNNPSATRRGFSVCDRTQQVAEAIRAAASAENCGQVTNAQLAAIINLTIEGKSITALKEGDFDGLTAMTNLDLEGNALTALPDGILRRLNKVTHLDLQRNQLASFTAGDVRGMTSLQDLRLNNNDLTVLDPEMIAVIAPTLTRLEVAGNALTALPAGIFDGTKLGYLDLINNDLETLPDDIFEKLTLFGLFLDNNPDATDPVTFKPTANAGNDQSVAQSATVTLSGTATGPWGDEKVTYAWHQVTGPSSNTVQTTNPVPVSSVDGKPGDRTFTAPGQNETLYFRLVATPVPAPNSFLTSFAASDPDWVTITVGTGSGQVVAPSVSSVSLSAPPGDDNGWDPGDAVEAVLTFDEAVTVDTTNGTPGVTVKLGEDETEKTADYASGSGTAALTFRYTLAAEEGPYTEALLEADSLALNGGTIQSTATQADASLAHNGAAQIYLRSTVPDNEDPGPTATFSNVPESHDGERAFEVNLAFSAESSIISYVTVRDSLLEVTGGTVTVARRQTKGSNVAWILTVRPSGPGDVTLTLPVRECDAANAVCVGGEPIVRAATATIAGPPFTASFDGAPSEHDGATFTMNFRISVELAGLSYVTVRDSLFTVAGGRIANARRLVRGKNRDWELTVAPEGYGAVTLDLIPTTDCEGTPGLCDAIGRMLAGPLSLTVEGPPALSVADAEVEEAGGAALAFTVTLSRALDEVVTVAYATSDGTATAGSDYTAASGTLTFAAGDTTRTVSVAVLDDAHDEDDETVTFALSNPSPSRVKLADAKASGTITNTDLMPAAWTARFGRTVAEQVLDAMDRRMQAARTPGVDLSLAGQPLDWNAGGEAATLAGPPHGLPVDLADWLRDASDRNGTAPRERTLTARDLALDSTFALTTETGPPGAGGGTLSVWGRGAVSHFDGREGDLTLDGEVASALLGADWRRGRMLAGLIVGHSLGDGGYRSPAGNGLVSSTLTGLYPWGRYALSERIDAWGAAGYGAGTLTLTPDGQAAIRTDLDLWLAAAGLRGALVDGGAGGFTLAAKTDALAVQTSTAAVAGDLAASDAGVTRLRLALEGTLPVRLAGGSVLTPSLELGVRHDGGDAETGFGADVGAGLAWRDPQRGLTAELRARGLLVHEADGLREVGLSGSLGWNPVEGDRGPSLSLTQSLGGASAGGAEALLQRGTLGGLAANAGADAAAGELGSQRLEARFGHGFAVFGDRFTLTPEAAVGLSGTGRDYRLGWRLVRVERQSGLAGGPLALSFEATRRERPADDGAPPEHAVGVRLTSGF